MERLQKVMAYAGLASRREAEKMILAGRVKVNGKVVQTQGVKVSHRDRIEVDDIPIYREEPVYYLFNKPDKVISAVSDDKGRKVVVDYFKNIPQRIYPVGRLDYHTTGVLILTNDGELANLLMHPRYQLDKVYVAKITGFLTPEEIHRLETGVVIDSKKTAPAKVQVRKNKQATKNATVEITIHEGRNRQVRKMFEAVGHPVKKLTREQYGFLTVEDLRPGEYRPLLKSEVLRLKQQVQK